MFNFKRQYRAALQPLLDRALAMNGDERRDWLEDLRHECPTVTSELECLMGPALRAPAVDPASNPTSRLQQAEPVTGSLAALGLRH